MLGKLVIGAAGFAAGYVIGTRKGRIGYERLKDRAAQAWQSGPVQSSVGTAQEFASERIPIVGEGVASAIDRASTKASDAARARRNTGEPTDTTGPAPLSATDHDAGEEEV